MNFTFLPDLFALGILVVILLLVRRHHSDARANAWLVGLFITLLEGVAHTFYAPQGMPSAYLHVVVTDCYMLAGLVFIWAAGDQQLTRSSRLTVLILNGLPLLMLATLYGLNLRYTQIYLPAVIGGAVIGVATSLGIRRNWLYAVFQLMGWAIVAYLVHEEMYRQAVYWSLTAVYAIAAFNFQMRLERRSTGRLAIVTGFSIWALFFLIHPWIVVHANQYADVASHMWNLQKSLISIGMILVMLEHQASNNEFLAHHDELTGLPNRRMFSAYVGRAIELSDRHQTGLAVVVLDLNGFKKINDTLGHLAGDHVLREVSAVLRKNIRVSDHVSRLGGDEFIVVASEMTGENAAQRFADSLRAAIERPILINGQSLMVSASVGFAMYPEDARDITKLLRIADSRMYTGKKKMPIRITPLDTGYMALPPTA